MSEDIDAYGQPIKPPDATNDKPRQRKYFFSSSQEALDAYFKTAWRSKKWKAAFLYIMTH
jgi:hypothetical protein